LISIVHSGRDLLLGFIARRTGWKPAVRASEASLTHLSTRAPEAADTTGAPSPLVAHDVRVPVRAADSSWWARR